MKMNGVGFKNWVNKAKLNSREVTLYLISPIINPRKYRKKPPITSKDPFYERFGKVVLDFRRKTYLSKIAELNG